MNKTKEVHRQVEELSTSAMLLVMKTNNITGTIRSIKEFTPILINRIPNITFEAEQVLEAIPLQCKHYKFHPENDHLAILIFFLSSLVPDIREHNLLVSEAINSINASFNDTAAQLQATAVSLEIGEKIVNSVLNLLDLVSFSCRLVGGLCLQVSMIIYIIQYQ